MELDLLDWAFQKRMMSWDFHTLQSLDCGICRWKCLIDENSQRRMARLVQFDSQSNQRSLQPRWAEKHLRKHIVSNLEVNTLQQQTTTSTPVSKEQESEVTVRTGWLKLDSWRLEKEVTRLIGCYMITWIRGCTGEANVSDSWHIK